MNTPYPKSELARMKTISSGHCCDLKVATVNNRVWLCRANGKISVEHLRGGTWDLDVDHGVEVK